MLVFPSARSAVLCAVDIQRTMQAHSRSRPADLLRAPDRHAHRRGDRRGRRPVRSLRRAGRPNRRVRPGAGEILGMAGSNRGGRPEPLSPAGGPRTAAGRTAPTPKRDAVEAHVETCPSCRSARPAAPPRPSPVRQRRALAEPGEDFLGHGCGSSRRPRRPRPPPAPRAGRLGLPRAVGTGSARAAWEPCTRRARRAGQGGRPEDAAGRAWTRPTSPGSSNEVRATGRLDHPNIVAAHDAGEHEGVHYLVMDFVDGVDLGRLVERAARLPVADACELVRQAARPAARLRAADWFTATSSRPT